MTDALSKVSSAEGPGRKGTRDSFAKQEKPVFHKRTDSTEDTVEISDEARDRSGGRRRKKLWEYIENHIRPK